MRSSYRCCLSALAGLTVLTSTAPARLETNSNPTYHNLSFSHACQTIEKFRMILLSLWKLNPT